MNDMLRFCISFLKGAESEFSAQVLKLSTEILFEWALDFVEF